MTCATCGRPMAIGLIGDGVSNHLLESGEIDHDTDRDHAAIDEQEAW